MITKVYTLATLDNELWTDKLFGSFVTFSGHDMGQFTARMEDSPDIRGRLIYRGNGKNRGVYLELLASGKIVDLKCDPIADTV